MLALSTALAAILGTFVGTVATYVVTRSNMRLTLEHSYDQALQNKRLERYQALFHVSRCLPRYWRPQEEPTREEIRQYLADFHDWYFGEEAGGMFLSPAAKTLYMQMMNRLAETAYKTGHALNNEDEVPLSDAESDELRDLGSQLRHQLAEDVGTAHPPRLRWTRLGSTSPPPREVSQ